MTLITLNNRQIISLPCHTSFLSSQPLKTLAELTDGPTLYVRCPGSLLVLFRLPTRCRCTNDSLSAFRFKIPTPNERLHRSAVSQVQIHPVETETAMTLTKKKSVLTCKYECVYTHSVKAELISCAANYM